MYIVAFAQVIACIGEDRLPEEWNEQISTLLIEMWAFFRQCNSSSQYYSVIATSVLLVLIEFLEKIFHPEHSQISNRNRLHDWKMFIDESIAWFHRSVIPAIEAGEMDAKLQGLAFRYLTSLLRAYCRMDSGFALESNALFFLKRREIAHTSGLSFLSCTFFSILIIIFVLFHFKNRTIYRKSCGSPAITLEQHKKNVD